MSNVALRVAGLKKRYGDVTAVDGLSFEVRRGEILGFLGPNGAGKTTTLNMLCGLLAPDAGSIEIDGAPAKQARGSRSIGVSPQDIVIWEMLTCREQLEFMGRAYDLTAAAARRRAGELLAIFGLQEKAGKVGRTLSGGMQRRLNIALALVHDPEILFLDEPQAGLDPQSRVLVREHIRSLAGRVSVVVTTHDMEEAEKLSDRVCIIDRGRVLALDTVEGVKGALGEGDIFEFVVAEEVSRQLLPFAVEGLPPEAVSIRGRVITFTSAKGPEALPGFLRDLLQRGLHLQDVRVRRRTLEDVFIRLTGRGLRE